jgi:hypothetical protein
MRIAVAHCEATDAMDYLADALANVFEVVSLFFFHLASLYIYPLLNGEGLS